MNILYCITFVIISLCCKHCWSFSACDEVDVIFLIDTDSIINYSSDIISLIGKIAKYGTSEQAGFSVIVYGNNIPKNMNPKLLSLSETGSIIDRLKEEKKIKNILNNKFNKIINLPDRIKSISILEAFNLGNSQLKPIRNHKRTKQVIDDIPGVGFHDDEDEYLIFDYNNNLIDNDTKDICSIFKHVSNTENKETVHFLLGQEIDDLNSISIKCNDKSFKPKIEKDTFINFDQIVDDSDPIAQKQELEIIYSITCPITVDASNELGPGQSFDLGNHIQLLDVNTVMQCDLTDDPDTPQLPDLTDDSYILIKDYINDDNTFQINDYLLTSIKSIKKLSIKVPSCCDLPPVQITKIIDDNENNYDDTFIIRRLYLRVPKSAMEYIESANLIGKLDTPPNFCPADPNNNNYNDNDDDDERRRLVSYRKSLLGGAKQWKRDYSYTKSYNSNRQSSWSGNKRIVGKGSITVKYGYYFKFDALLNINFKWKIRPWGYVDAKFSIDGYFETGAYFNVKIKGSLTIEFRKILEYTTTLKPRIAGIAFIIRPFFILNAKVKTKPLQIYAGVDCKYRREFEIGYWFKTDKWWKKFRSGKIQSSKTTKKGCTKKLSVGNGNILNTCSPISLGFDLHIEPIIGVAFYELVAAWIRGDILIPFRVEYPELNKKLCPWAKCNTDGLQASFKISKMQLTLYFGYKTDFGKIFQAIVSLVTGLNRNKMRINSYTGKRIGGPWTLIGPKSLGCVNLKSVIPYSFRKHISDKCCSSKSNNDYYTFQFKYDGFNNNTYLLIIFCIIIILLLILTIISCYSKQKNNNKYVQYSGVKTIDSQTDDDSEIVDIQNDQH